MSQKLNAAVSVVGINIGKNSFHIVGHDECGAIVLRQKWSRGQVEARFAGFGTPDLVGCCVQGGIDHGGSLSNFGIARGESSMPSDPPDV